jgi:hypothetical protein
MTRTSDKDLVDIEPPEVCNEAAGHQLRRYERLHAPVMAIDVPRQRLVGSSRPGCRAHCAMSRWLDAYDTTWPGCVLNVPMSRAAARR